MYLSETSHPLAIAVVAELVAVGSSPVLADCRRQLDQQLTCQSNHQLAACEHVNPLRPFMRSHLFHLPSNISMFRNTSVSMLPSNCTGFLWSKASDLPQFALWSRVKGHMPPFCFFPLPLASIQNRYNSQTSFLSVSSSLFNLFYKSRLFLVSLFQCPLD